MEVFIQAVRNTVVLTISVVVIELIVAFGLALLLNQNGDAGFQRAHLGARVGGQRRALGDFGASSQYQRGQK